MELNKDFKTRDKLILGKEVNWGETIGGIVSFNGLNIETLKELREKNFLDTKESQNDSRSIQEFINFMESNPGFTAHGYIVSPDRPDYRVSIEGIKYTGDWTKPELLAFYRLAAGADEVIIHEDYLFCWWD